MLDSPRLDQLLFERCVFFSQEDSLDDVGVDKEGDLTEDLIRHWLVDLKANLRAKHLLEISE